MSISVAGLRNLSAEARGSVVISRGDAEVMETQKARSAHRDSPLHHRGKFGFLCASVALCDPFLMH
jgi:hypothetical protein